MKVKQKALDEVNEITYDTKAGITTTLVHTFKPCIDLFDGNEHIAHYENDTEFIEDFKKMKQENKQLKADLEMYENGVYFSSENDKLQNEIDNLNHIIDKQDKDITILSKGNKHLKEVIDKEIEYLEAKRIRGKAIVDIDVLEGILKEVSE